MKTKIIFLIAFLMGIGIVLTMAATTTYHQGSRQVSQGSDLMCVKIAKGTADINNTTTMIYEPNYATLERIVIDANGTDIQFSLYLYDTSTTYNDITLFSKTDCNTVTIPHSYALSQADTAGNDFLGIPVFGPLSLVVDDVNDTTLDYLEVQLFYRRSE